MDTLVCIGIEELRGAFAEMSSLLEVGGRLNGLDREGLTITFPVHKLDTRTVLTDSPRAVPHDESVEETI